MMFSQWLKGMRLKVLTLGLLPLVAAFIIGIYSIIAFNKLDDVVHNVYNQRIKLIQAANRMDASVHAIGRWTWITYGFMGNNEKRAEFVGYLKEEVKSFNENLKLYLSLKRNPNAVDIFSPAQNHWSEVQLAIESSVGFFEKNTNEDNESAKKILQTKLAPNLVPLTKIFNKLNILMDEILLKEVKEAESFVRNTKTMLVVVFLACCLIACISTYKIALNLTGEFTQISNLLKSTSHEVSSIASQVASSTYQLSQSAVEQSSSLQETSASLEEISSIVSDNAEKTSKAKEVSNEGQKMASNSFQTLKRLEQVNELIDSENKKVIEDITNNISAVDNLIQSIVEISNKTKIINDIVFQTKLLSFNASVEAARAGEHGKGFSVVAEEIGKLAGVSGDSASEISTLINKSSDYVKVVTTNSENLIDSISRSGEQMSKEAQATLNDVHEMVTSVVSTMGQLSLLSVDIENGSKEQSKGVSEINKAVLQLNDVTHQNSNASTELNQSVEFLAEQARKLNVIVEKFNTVVNG